MTQEGKRLVDVLTGSDQEALREYLAAFQKDLDAKDPKVLVKLPVVTRVVKNLICLMDEVANDPLQGTPEERQKVAAEAVLMRVHEAALARKNRNENG